MKIKTILWSLLIILFINGCCNSSFVREYDSPLTPFDEISQDSFLSWHNDYKANFLPVMNDPTLNLKDSVGVNNLGIEYYKLQDMEVAELFYYLKSVNSKLDTNVHVYLFPVIRENNGRKELDMVFSIMKDPTKLETGVQFDFSKPCPPICGSEYTVIGN